MMLVKCAVVAVALGFCLMVEHSQAVTTGFSYTATVYDPTNALSKTTKSQLLADFGGAMALWQNALVMKGTLRVQLQIVSEPGLTADGRSTSNKLVGYSGGIPVYEEGAAHAIRTGINLLPGQPDVIIRINPSYIKNEAWLDPRPTLRIDTVPSNKIDFVSILTHEMGHAFGFNGFINQSTGQLDPAHLSLFDTFIVHIAGGVYFAGGHVEQVYGGAIPLTNQDFYHYGNYNTPALFMGLMNGVYFYYGTRYWIGSLELAFMQDLGQTLRPRR